AVWERLMCQIIISTIRSIEYNAKYMKVFKASNIGEGVSVPYKNIDFSTNMRLASAFTVPIKDEDHAIMPKNGCTSTFESSADFDAHISANLHKAPPSNPRTSNGIARLHLIEAVRSINTQIHRNKEKNVWASALGHSAQIVVQDTGATARLYDAGESCRPETCSIACTRRGRVHAHLKECPGLSTCPAKMYPYVRHSDETWEPYPTKKFDLWLCQNYWHSLDWEQPLDLSDKTARDAVQLISKCSFVCAHSNGHLGEVEHRFCSKEAWHTDQHAFDCKHPVVSKLDIVFVCDTTGSMGGYMNEIKTNTCQRIMNTATKVVNDVQFRFVAYRDHPPQDSTYVIKTSNAAGEFCNATQLQAFVATLDASGGGDGPESVLDGLWDAGVTSKWRDTDTLKYVIHIADAPPHGRLYTNGSGDGFPEGCPCGITIERIATVLNKKEIRYKPMKIGSGVNTMATIFRKHITQYEESDLSGTLDLTNKFVGILARDLQVKEMDVHEIK
ncbi:unnamed protein product, partial [Rotaria socialis]